jgi:tetratricopeptide (TPR) repeat protein
MADGSRLEDLRRRVQQDPSSIAFAQLAEEYRRAGQLQESVDVCRAGLALHPGYLSARVTLGRALLDLNQLDAAKKELETVLKSAAENLAAIRGLAEIHHRRGALAEALVQYRAALALARNDPDLEQTVKDLAAELEPTPRAADGNGLSFEQATRALTVEPPSGQASGEDVEEPGDVQPQEPVEALEAVGLPGGPGTESREMRTIAALEQWLHAIHVTRAEHHA